MIVNYSALHPSYSVSERLWCTSYLYCCDSVSCYPRFRVNITVFIGLWLQDRGSLINKPDTGCVQIKQGDMQYGNITMKTECVNLKPNVNSLLLILVCQMNHIQQGQNPSEKKQNIMIITNLHIHVYALLIFFKDNRYTSKQE